MLLPNNEYLRRYIINETLEQYRREAEVDRWMAEIRPRRPSKQAERAGKVLQNLGYAFRTFGRHSKIQSRRAHSHVTPG